MGAPSFYFYPVWINLSNYLDILRQTHRHSKTLTNWNIHWDLQETLTHTFRHFHIDRKNTDRDLETPFN